MAKSTEKGKQAEADKPLTLYEKLIVATGLHVSDYPDVNAYKNALVDWYNTKDKKVGDERYESSPEEVQDWIDTATEVKNLNLTKAAKKKEPFPALDGLPEPEEDEEDMATETKVRRGAKARNEGAPMKRGPNAGRKNRDAEEIDEVEAPVRRGRPPKEGKSEGVKQRGRPRGESSGRDPLAGCYGQTYLIIAKNPKLSLEQVTDRLNRDGNEYSDVTIAFAYKTGQTFILAARQAGLID